MKILTKPYNSVFPISYFRWFPILLTLIFVSCKEDKRFLYEKVDSGTCNVYFANNLNYTEELNAYTYRNFYNGAGVAIGDINNDGLADIYISGNQVDNKLYLNKGGFKFSDITGTAGVSCENVWSTGVTMADVNGDGWLDIYVCKSGPVSNEVNRRNQLFINNRDLTFTDRAEEYGINDLGLSVHAAFFDMDNDYDLDMYLLNNSGRSIGGYDLRKGQRDVRDTLGSNKLFRNDGDSFHDISEEAGIYGSAIGYGLGVTVADLNNDGWQDIYVSNDFFERDYLYVNNADGTFKEDLVNLMPETSLGSMGADIADVNGDGLLDIYVTEMLPNSLERVKTKAVFEDWNKYKSNFDNGYHRQFSRNVLQLNNGLISDSLICFSEASRLAQVEATDWSWGALIFDANNDATQDIFVANGIAKDMTDQDYINFYANSSFEISNAKADSTLITSLMDRIPSTPLSNYLFINEGNLLLRNRSIESGLPEKTFSSGSAYGDLDNDGDLDLVVNNINSPVSIYRNKSEAMLSANFLQITFKGKGKNTTSLGAKVKVYHNNQFYYKEQNPVKGYMSSVDHKLHFGLGDILTIDSMSIQWQDGTISWLFDISANQAIVVDESDVIKQEIISKNTSDYEFKLDNSNVKYRHKENEYVDFNRDPLLTEMYSNEGPTTAIGDINGDGFDDIFVGGSKGFSGKIYINSANGLNGINQPALEEDKRYEDSDAVFADIDNDSDIDLVVVSGGNEFAYASSNLKNRVYLNDGNGSFAKKGLDHFTESRESSGFVRAFDFDDDGDLDLLEGTRFVPFAYGVSGDIRFYKNDGSGNFTVVNSEKFTPFKEVGMLTDALIEDYDQDGDQDIIVAGHWMPITIFTNEEGRFSKYEIPNSSGWWNSLLMADVNLDGMADIVVGNHGLNSRFRATVESPLVLYVNDFDQNGSIENIICKMVDGKEYPMTLLSELGKQIPSIRKSNQTFDSYKSKTIRDLFDEPIVSRSVRREVVNLETSLFLNSGKDSWVYKPLPKEVNYSKVYDLAAIDISNDGDLDIVYGGNQYRAQPQFGINAAFVGGYLNNDGGNFNYVSASKSGLHVTGEVRSIAVLNALQKLKIFYFRNSDSVVVYEY